MSDSNTGDNNQGNEETITEIGHDIVKSFHEQFAQNQNHHQSLFLQVLTILLSVLIGFGYLYIRVDASKPDIKITIEALQWYLILSMYLLSLAIAIISNMAYGFRRDQLMACNIRILSGVMNRDDDTNFFFSKFNPQGKTNPLKWMPEFHFIFFWSLIFIKIILTLSTVYYEGKSVDTTITSKFGLVYFSFLLDFIVAFYYWFKWKRCSNGAPAILIRPK